MLLQLNPTLPVLTPNGPAHAHLVIDMGQEHHLLWVCFMDATGECWTYPNRDVRLQPNSTMGRRSTSPITTETPGPQRGEK